MQKWEYKQHEIGSAVIAEAANQFGDEGWELIALVSTEPHVYQCIFKRPLQKKTSQPNIRSLE